MCFKTILAPLVRTQDSSQQDSVTAPSGHVVSVYTCITTEDQA